MEKKVKTRVFFIVPPEVHLLDVSGPIQVFYEASEYGAKVELVFLAIDGNDSINSSAGIGLNKLEPFRNHTLNENDFIFIPGLDARLVFDEAFKGSLKPFFEWLQIQKNNGAKICSVCTGAYLLAYSGVLKNMECTTHWKYTGDFKKRFPETTIHEDRLFVKDGSIYSSAGISSGIDLALFIIEELFGPFFATKIAKEIVIFLRRTEDDPQLSVFLQYRNHIENRIHKVQDHLAQHLSNKQKIEDLADLVFMSPRNLTRLFKKTTGITIGEYHDKLRVERAVQLLSNGQKVNAVSDLCGLSSNQLRSLLKKYSDILPSTLS
ncbi:GlxA family transcriptional regulator [Ekhidna sp.]|uniref:GlxA family transcriptional regulator n=1 Tax=Ekhidna sp. TaxID=2608089 RepID=UPI003B509FE9